MPMNTRGMKQQQMEALHPSIHVVLMAAVGLTLLVPPSHGCFPIKDVLAASCIWIQQTSIQDRNRISVCAETDGVQNRISVTHEGMYLGQPTTLKCLRSYGEYRYLAEVIKSSTIMGYQCIKFDPLTKEAIRQSKSQMAEQRSQLDCESMSSYITDEALLIADDSEEIRCPIAGGYQMHLRMGESISKSEDCLISAISYKPHIQFSCDLTGSSSVIADLGYRCTPRALWESQKLRRRYIAHLSCVDTWKEKEGTSDEFMTILLRMRDAPLTHWCLHMKLEQQETGEYLYQTFLTFDGRCLQEIHGPHDVPKSSAMFGTLASFNPSNSTKCTDNSVAISCARNPDLSCEDSLACPGRCGRCKPKITDKRCTFFKSMRGLWQSFSQYQIVPNITIDKHRLTSPGFGEFECIETTARPFQAKGLYKLVQVGEDDTCMPYYACVYIDVPAPGVFNLQMRPTLRDIHNGNVQSCSETVSSVWDIRPTEAEEMVTFMEPNRLNEMACDIDRPLAFTSAALGGECVVTVNECSGTCKTFNLSLVKETCGNQTVEDAKIYSQYICMARMLYIIENKSLYTWQNNPPTNKHVVALLTKLPPADSDNENVYFCWVFYDNQAMVLQDSKCNPEAIKDIFVFQSRIGQTYDPILRIFKTVSASGGNTGNHSVKLNAFNLMLVLSMLFAFFISFMIVP